MDLSNQTEPLIYSELEDAEEFGDLIELFVSGLAERIDRLEELASADDTRQLQVEAHQLRGAAGGYGFPSISELAAKVDESLRRGEHCRAILDDLHQLIDTCRRARVC